MRKPRWRRTGCFYLFCSKQLFEPARNYVEAGQQHEGDEIEQSQLLRHCRCRGSLT